jgi:hypothetical protein
MADESKIEPGKSLLKGFLTNPINWILGAVTLGSVLFAAGAGSARKTYDVSDLKKEISDIKSMVQPLKVQSDTITNKLDRHIKAQIITSTSVNSKLDDVTGNQEKLKKLVTDEFSKSMTPKQVLDMMNYLEKKNNGQTTSMIQSVNTDQ